MSYALATTAARRTEGDYGVVRHAVTFISQHRRSQPGVEATARFCSVTPEELHRLLRRWAGLTPREFMAAITLDRARQLLRGRASVPDTLVRPVFVRGRLDRRPRSNVGRGLSGPGRRHDLFVTHEAMSPGEWKARGHSSMGSIPRRLGTRWLRRRRAGLPASPWRTGVRKPVPLMICGGASRRHDSARTRHAPPRWRDACSIPTCGERTGRCGWS
jgi:AraC-like DNA-binding protein